MIQKIYLVLTGWILPTDTSLNIQIDQNPSLGPARISFGLGTRFRIGVGLEESDRVHGVSRGENKNHRR